MIKTISAERTIDAPAAVIYDRLASIARHPEWDETAQRAEPVTEGNATGVGAEWKVYEHFGIFHSISGDDRSKQGTALSKRTLKELVPNERVAWGTHTLPNLGVSATLTRTLTPEGSATRVVVDVSISVPMVVERVGRVLFRSLDERYEKQLVTTLDQLRAVSEAEVAKQAVAV